MRWMKIELVLMICDFATVEMLKSILNRWWGDDRFESFDIFRRDSNLQIFLQSRWESQQHGICQLSKRFFNFFSRHWRQVTNHNALVLSVKQIDVRCQKMQISSDENMPMMWQIVQDFASIIIIKENLLITFWISSCEASNSHSLNSRASKKKSSSFRVSRKFFIAKIILRNFSSVSRIYDARERRKIELLIDQNEKESGNFSWNRKSRTLTANKTEKKIVRKLFCLVLVLCSKLFHIRELKLIWIRVRLSDSNWNQIWTCTANSKFSTRNRSIEATKTNYNRWSAWNLHQSETLNQFSFAQQIERNTQNCSALNYDFMTSAREFGRKLDVKWEKKAENIVKIFRRFTRSLSHFMSKLFTTFATRHHNLTYSEEALDEMSVECDEKKRFKIKKIFIVFSNSTQWNDELCMWQTGNRW